MAKELNFGKITAMEIYTSEYNKDKSFCYIRQEIELTFDTRSDGFYEGVTKTQSKPRTCLVAIPASWTLEDVQKHIDAGDMRINRDLALDLRTVLTDSQLDYLKVAPVEQREELLTKWENKHLVSNEHGEPWLFAEKYSQFSRNYLALKPEDFGDKDSRQEEFARFEEERAESPDVVHTPQFEEDELEVLGTSQLP